MNIKELAEQAGISFGGHPMNPLSVYFSELKRFAELVAAAERESCARLCESMGVHPALNVYNGGPEWYQRQKECAAAIRARGDKHD